MIKRYPLRHRCLLLGVLLLTACSTIPPSNVRSNARVTPATNITRALTQLPEPKAKIAVAVYGLRDQTGQYRASPDSPYSTAVTQGAATMLVEALRESGWYIPVEREGLQNLLTERRIVRAIESPSDKGKPAINLPNLMPASLIIEGGITAYESNVRTGGKGANLLGIGADTQYRVDQVTVGLRSVDIRTGQVLSAVAITKTIYSFKLDASIYQFISYKKLLQGETGYSTNEPAQLAVREAIEAAVVHLTVLGVRDRIFELRDENDWNSPIIQSALRERQNNLAGEDRINNDGDDEEPIAMQPRNNGRQPQMSPLARQSVRPEPPPASIEEPKPKVESEAGPGKALAVDPGLIQERPVAKTAPATPATSPSSAAATASAQPKDAVSPAGQAPSGASPANSSAPSDDIFKTYWQRKPKSGSQ